MWYGMYVLCVVWYYVVWDCVVRYVEFYMNATYALNSVHSSSASEKEAQTADYPSAGAGL